MVDEKKKKMLVDDQYISPEDTKLFQITDDPKEAMAIINELSKKRKLATNF
jgi:nitrogen regulatory protein PII-like uncharacterized protein